MSYWLISVPNQTRAEKAIFSELESVTKALAKAHLFRVPQLKVGTLDTLMSLSDDLAKYDTQVGQVAKKVEKTYFDLSKADDDKKEGVEAKDAGKAKKEESKQQEVEQLKVGNASARDFVEKFSWNETRYPKRSPLRTLTDLIVKEATKSDDALKKQLAEYNEIRSTYAAIDRKDTGSLLVKGLAGLVKEKDLIEKGHLTTLLVVVPRLRAAEFEEQYEGMEELQREKDESERKRKEIETQARAAADAERAAKESSEEKSKRREEQPEHEDEEKGHDPEREAADALLKKASEEKAKQEADKKAREDKERDKYKRLPCPVVVPRSAKKLYDDEKDEFVLYRIVVIREGAEYIKNILRERRMTVRPYKHDPAEEKAEKQKKAELAQKKKTLWVSTHIAATPSLSHPRAASPSTSADLAPLSRLPPASVMPSSAVCRTICCVGVPRRTRRCSARGST